LNNQLFAKILDSSIWLEDSDTRIVWITLLAVIDEDGMCRFASPANVAIRAGSPQRRYSRTQQVPSARPTQRRRLRMKDAA
jgi:hypothetical protein